MDYFEIIKKAYKIAWQNKYLWIFGLLAGGGVGIYRGTSSYSDLGTLNGDLLMFTAIFAMVLIPILIVLNLTSTGALIRGYSDIDLKEKGNFKDNLSAGFAEFWRLLWLNILFVLMVLATLIILISPVVALAIAKNYVFSVLVGILLLLLCIFVWIIIAFIYPYSVRMVVLEKKNVLKCIRSALHFTRHHFLDVFVVYLILFAINMVYVFAILFALVIIGLLLFTIGFGIFLLSQLAAIIYGSLAIVILIVLFMVIASAYNTFNSGVITLTYLQLKKKSIK